MRERNYGAMIKSKEDMTVDEFTKVLDKVGDDLYKYLTKVTDPKCDVEVTTINLESKNRGGLMIKTSLSKNDLENSIYSYLNAKMFDVEVREAKKEKQKMKEDNVIIPMEVLMNNKYDQIANAYYKNPDGSVDIVIIGIDSEGKSHTLGVVKPEDMEEPDDIPSVNL